MTVDHWSAPQAKEKPLYGPEGSSEGKVDPNTHKAQQVALFQCLIRQTTSCS